MIETSAERNNTFEDNAVKAAPRNASLLSTIVLPTISVIDAMGQLDSAGTGALLVCNNDRQLLGLLTDGDIRRAILQSRSLDVPCIEIANRNPTTTPAPVSTAEALRIMKAHDINQLPVVDENGNVVEFLLRKDLISAEEIGVSAVIMAGGFGKRLRPLTETVPKPMLPIGDRPLLQRTIEQLRKSGVTEVNLTTHYLPEAISHHFGNGANFGVKINYCEERSPLGTAGGIRLVKNETDTLLIMNGDILTGLPLQDFLDFHNESHADMTVGIRKYEIQVPFGVVESNGVQITSLKEKPSISVFINAGTYLIAPSVRKFIPEGCRFDMTDLIDALIIAGRTVVGFPIREYWLDVGRQEDYLQAQDDVLNGRI